MCLEDVLMEKNHSLLAAVNSSNVPVMFQLYLQVRHARCTNGINCQVRAGKADEMRLLREESVSKEPPEKKERKK